MDTLGSVFFGGVPRQNSLTEDPSPRDDPNDDDDDDYGHKAPGSKRVVRPASLRVACALTLHRA